MNEVLMIQKVTDLLNQGKDGSQHVTFVVLILITLFRLIRCFTSNSNHEI